MAELSRIRTRAEHEVREQRRGNDRWARGMAVGLIALVVFASAGAWAQESSTETLKGGVSYSDQSSDDCEQQNVGNPYAEVGMNPLVCYGIMAPADSRKQCSLPGMRVLKQDGETCYYCSPITLPSPAIILPIDQVGAAQLQGWGCGLDQVDACKVICTGGKTFTPPTGTVVSDGGPGLPPTPAPNWGGPSGELRADARARRRHRFCSGS